MPTGDISSYAIYVSSRWGGVLSKDHYQVQELRATANYLIDDRTGTRYKRSTPNPNSEYLAHYRNKERWSSTVYVYALDSEFIKKVNERNAKIDLVCKVTKALDDLKPKAYEDAIRVAEMIGLDLPEVKP